MRKSAGREQRRRARAWLGLALCALVLLASLAYMLRYEHTRRSILRDNAAYSALYDAPDVHFAALASAEAPVPTAGTSTPEPAPASPTAPAPTQAAPSATPMPTEVPASTYSFAVAVDETLSPLGTANADTLIYAEQTPPPPRESFSRLLARNPETVGFLTIDGVISLPVVQRPNDNEFYLDHGFDLQESIGGALFLDGSNLLFPEDDCLIVYGHNMKNGTMFHPLVNYEQLAFLREHPLVRLDTLYADRVWAPFAALTVTADPDSERYLNLRQFVYDEPGFALFVRSLRALSVWDSPIDVAYGDKLLLLVTCEYSHDNGRFVLALRAARDDETWDQLWAQVQESS